MFAEVKLLKTKLEGKREMHQINLLPCNGKTKNLLQPWQNKSAWME